MRALDYVKTMNELQERLRFDNTLTANCSTGVLLHTRVNPESPPLSWEVPLSGYASDYAYYLGRLDTTRPFPELERMSKVNERAHAADKDPQFSQRIREGLPIRDRRERADRAVRDVPGSRARRRRGADDAAAPDGVLTRRTGPPQREIPDRHVSVP